MREIDAFSRATVEFTLTWNSENTSHQEQLWADPVSFWRDVLVSDLIKELVGKGPGVTASTPIPADCFPAPWEARKRVLVRPVQFQHTDRQGRPLVLRPGRFYPQGLLQGVGGVYPASTSPCRFLGQEGDRLVFDCNHPLAGHDLHLAAEIVALHPSRTERGGRCEDWLERISSDGPGMQARYVGEDGALSAEDTFQRIDERPDGLFYRQPRLVQHLDQVAREEIGRRYAELIRPGGRVLDLMGSWTSHLPDTLELGSLTVLGMNPEELRQNRRATDTLVADLNLDPRLPLADASFDAVICTASVEYLTQPLAVMAEIRRTLRPGGLLAFAFSNRWFPAKAIRIWTELHEFERLGLVAELFHTVGGFGGITTASRRGLPRPQDDPHQELWYSDPVYMVLGIKA